MIWEVLHEILWGHKERDMKKRTVKRGKQVLASALLGLCCSMFTAAAVWGQEQADFGEIVLEEASAQELGEQVVQGYADTEVFIRDAALKAALNRVLAPDRAADAPITQRELESLTELDLSGAGIQDLEGLHYAVNLQRIDLSRNHIWNFLYLQDLEHLEEEHSDFSDQFLEPSYDEFQFGGNQIFLNAVYDCRGNIIPFVENEDGSIRLYARNESGDLEAVAEENGLVQTDDTYLLPEGLEHSEVLIRWQVNERWSGQMLIPVPQYVSMEVPFETEIIEDAEMFADEEIIEQEGLVGLARACFIAGRERWRELDIAPTPRRIRRGSRLRNESTSGESSGSGEQATAGSGQSGVGEQAADRGQSGVGEQVTAGREQNVVGGQRNSSGQSTGSAKSYTVRKVAVLTNGKESVGTWVEDAAGKWFRQGNGYPMKRWIYNSNEWYYLNERGYRHSGWLRWNNDWYYLDEQGRLLKDAETPDGYRVDTRGIWVE